MKVPAPIAFSGVLQEFIEPICVAGDTGASLMLKSELGRLVWNYSISLDLQLSIAADLHQAITKSCAAYPAMNPVIQLLMERKKTHFAQHKEFIVRVRKNDPAGGATLHVDYLSSYQVEDVLSEL
jgi:hypothetical protein